MCSVQSRAGAVRYKFRAGSWIRGEISDQVCARSGWCCTHNQITKLDLKPEMIGTTIGAGDGASCINLGVDQRSMQQNVITDQIYGHT